ncbi:hypothetical protein [Pedobacter insulae]|uniref:Uncharacterized protein n=1 Tax=Pedobacter insulae TaxID=414048 RepID=A0A1I2UU03_9SPHI|nr:hypothetical protein [Pedobacter insulae]SFG80635.1 hypothetical protein SAMN04489864_102352 [Pedobacter insulae]
MIKFTLLVWLLMFYHPSLDLAYIRSNYKVAVSDKDACEGMITELKKDNLNNVGLAYLGGFQAIWAHHTFNPITKLSTFNRGKANINKAILTDKNNIETRFIRLSIQKNCPRFLGYYKNIREDEAYLRKHVDGVSDRDLKNMIKSILKK